MKMKMDDIGRIVIPAYLREYLGLHRKNKLVFEQRPDAIVLKHWEGCYLFCSSEKSLIAYKGKLVCRDCLEGLKEMKMN